MDEKKSGVLMIPYVVYESAQSRSERYIRRLIAVLALALVLLVATNLMWLCAWSAYDYVSEESGVEIEADRNGVANFIGTKGDIYNGSTNPHLSEYESPD